MTIQDPADLLQDVVDEAARLLGSSGAVIDLLDPATGEVRWAHDAGIDDATRAEWQALGVGGPGVHLAIRERRVVVTDEYAADDRFPDGAPNREFFERAGIRSIAFAPLIGEAVVLGTLAVFSADVGRFGDQQAALLAALADLATIAIHNAELIRELGRSREEVTRRAETERTLREIAARVTSIRDADAILGPDRRGDAARPRLGRRPPHPDVRRPDVPAPDGGRRRDGRGDRASGCASRSSRSTAGSTASRRARVASSGRRATRPTRASHAMPNDLDVAERMGLGAMAAAPLRAPGGDVIGTLAVSYAQPGSIPADRLATLQALADHAAIALSNSDLLERVEASEANYRGLVQTTPDVIWRNDADGRFTFLADTAEDLFGWTAAEMTGMHFSSIVAEESMGTALQSWADLHDPGTSSLRLRFVVRRKDGSTFPTELSAVGIFEDGEFKGAQGTVRDVSERERLERIVHESEERYRSLVQSSPDLIFEMDGRGVYTFYSDRTEDVIGWLPGELIGHSFTEFIDIEAFPQAPQRLAEIAANPGRPSTDRLLLRHKDGRKIPFEVSVVGQVDDKGELVAIRGVARDISERERLELELRSSEERYRFLVDNAPDIVFSADQQTRFIYLSDTIERLTGWRPDELVGETFDRLVSPVDDARRGRPLGAGRQRPDDPAGPARRAHAQGRRHGAGRDPLRRAGRRAGQLRRRPRLRPRHRRARAPGARAARFRGPLPLPRPVVARPRVDDRRRRPVHVHVGPVGLDPRLGARGADRPVVQRARPARRATRRPRPLPGAPPAPDRGPSDAPADPQPRRPRARDGDHEHRHGRRTASSSARTAPAATSASATASSATCGARPSSSPRPRSGRTSRASCTTR